MTCLILWSQLLISKKAIVSIVNVNEAKSELTALTVTIYINQQCADRITK